MLGDDKQILESMVDEITADLSDCTSYIQMHQVFREVSKKTNMFLTMERVGMWSRWASGYIRDEDEAGIAHLEWEMIDGEE